MIVALQTDRDGPAPQPEMGTGASRSPPDSCRVGPERWTGKQGRVERWTGEQGRVERWTGEQGRLERWTGKQDRLEQRTGQAGGRTGRDGAAE